MNKRFSELLEEYLVLRKEVKKHNKLAYMSPHWDDTYGFGQSIIHKNLRRLADDLNQLVENLPRSNPKR